MKKINLIIFSALIIGILSFLYISMPPKNFYLTDSEHSFRSTNQFKQLHSQYIGKVIERKRSFGDPFVKVGFE